MLFESVDFGAGNYGQERYGKLLQLEEAAEDWADASEVPMELVRQLGRARFGVEELFSEAFSAF